MIKAKNGKATFKGTDLELLADYKGITKGMVGHLQRQGMPNSEIKNILNDFVEDELLSESERKAKLEKLAKELIGKITDKLSEFVKEENGGTDNE